MIPLACATASPSSTESTCGAISANANGPERFTRSATEPSSSSSMMYQFTSPFESHAKIGTIAGCCSCAASCASRRKRPTAVAFRATMG